MDLSLLLDPAILSELVFQGLVRGAMYALMGVGLALIFGILGIVNFAHGELFMLGAYVDVLLRGRAQAAVRGRGAGGRGPPLPGRRPDRARADRAACGGGRGATG